jgi:putative iron-regulated protein
MREAPVWAPYLESQIMKSRISPVWSTPLFALLTVACGGDDETAAQRNLPASAAAAVATYAEIVYATYQDTLSGAEELRQANAALVAAPSAANQTAAQQAWRAAREPYLQSEVFRFYDGPIDNAEDGVEGFINAWPLDEQHIDYVQEEPEAGIVNDPSVVIDADTLMQRNESPTETDISTGYHAIEFLLWGQDVSPTGPGQRPFTDYVSGPQGTAAHQDRRGQYLGTASDLLVEQLQQVTAAWEPDVASNYRAAFEAREPAAALNDIMSGMTILSGFETGGERVQAALDSGDQEEEHSCFSDNTHRDMVQDVRGIQNVWLGRYTRPDTSVVSGTSLQSVIAAGDPALAAEVTTKIQESLDLAEAIQPPFDREISFENREGRERVVALSVSLFEQARLLSRAFDVYGLTRIPDPE